jgi:hypothetical protein
MKTLARQMLFSEAVGNPMSDPELLGLSEAVNQDRDRLLSAKLSIPRGPITLLVTSQKARQSTVTLGVAFFLFGGIAYLVWYSWGFSQAMHAIFRGKTGPVLLRVEWPQPLKDLLGDSDAVEIDESSITVHCLNGGVWDREFVWRMENAPGLFELIEKRWKLDPVDGSDWGVLEGYIAPMAHERTPAWWTPRDDGQTVFYVSPYGYDGMGDHFRVGVDENRNTIWVDFYYKF